MKKGLKRQIKQDEIRTGFDHAWSWLGAHGDEAKITALVVVVLVGVTLGLGYYQSHRKAEAETAFAEALTVFHARVQGEDAPGAEPPAGAAAYATAAEKYRKAAAAFDGVERRYGSLSAGARARYYGALCRIELGERAEAEKTLVDLASHRSEGALEPALARLALADLHRRNGQIDKAAEEYRQLADDGGSPLPRDGVLMSLAGALEDANKASEAEKSYRRLLDEFPTSPFAGEARRRAEYLGAKG